MTDAETLTGGWEPDTPVDDSVLRQFVCAYADRVTIREHQPQPADPERQDP